MTIHDIRQQLIRDEGYRTKAYKDSVGKTTIGVGRNLDDVGLSSDEIEYLLQNDLARVRRDVMVGLPWSSQLNDARYGVLLNLCFNMGFRTLLMFRKLLAALEAGDWETAANELLDSKYAEQVGDRAKRLAEQLRKGEWV